MKRATNKDYQLYEFLKTDPLPGPVFNRNMVA